MKMAMMMAALAGASLVATPVLAASLNSKERARVARAAPRDRDDVRYCLLQGKKGRDKGTVIGAAGGAGVGAIAGGNLGESLLAGAAGAVAGRVIGKSEGTNSTCDRVLKRNP
jgi:outer membrane lipoprotein SlyB